MAQYTDEELDAREEGKSAYEEGKKRTDNPYSMLSQKNLYTCWDEGWEESKQEVDEENDDDQS